MSLTSEQKQRADALLVSRRVNGRVRVRDHIATATYICDGPGGWLVLERERKDVTVVNDVNIIGN